MLLEKRDWHYGYNQILHDCRPATGTSGGRGGTALLLCNLDADALCAARILSYAFRADNVLYQLRPCGGYSRLLYILERLKLNSQSLPDEDNEDNEGLSGNSGNGNSTIRAIILLNLGGTKNLTRLLFSPTPIEGPDNKETGEFKPALLDPDLTKIYILDSHRPYHLANVHAGRNVVLWNDFEHWHDPEGGGLPSDGDGLSGDEEESDDLSSNGSSDDESANSGDESSDDGEAEFEDAGPDRENTGGDNQDSVDIDEGLEKYNSDTYDGDNDEDGIEDEDEIDNQVKKKSKKPRNDLNLQNEGSNASDNDTRDSISNEGQMRTPDRTPKLEDYDQDNSSETSHVGINDEDIQSAPTFKSQKKRDPSSDAPPLSMRVLHQQRRDKIRLYYASGSYHSSPISYMTYTLASTQLRFENVGDLLWLACIGVTDAYIHNRLDLSGYAVFAIELKRHVHRIYPDERGNDGALNRSANAFIAESLYGDDFRNSNNKRTETQISLTENGRILFQNNEFRFFLLRHTNLWDSMRLSPHVCTKMELWKRSGVQKLKEMLAKMGLPLVQCQQPYAFMKAGLKKRLKRMILDHADDYGLDNISYTGFLRVSGYNSLLSASDMSFAITALLESQSPSTCSVVKGIGDKVEDGVNSSLRAACDEEEDRCLTQSFNVAYDALNSNGASSASSSTLGGITGACVEGSDLSNLVSGGKTTGSSGLGASLRLAMSLQNSIIGTAVSLVERKDIMRLSHFRYAYLHCTSQGHIGNFYDAPNIAAESTAGKDNSTANKEHHHHIFAKPLALTKLAHFLMDMHRSNNKWTGNKSRPLILMAEKPQTRTYVVVGYECPEEGGNVKKNQFGQNFELAAKTMKGTFKFDSFDSNVVEVKANDVQKFIEHLHYMMDSV